MVLVCFWFSWLPGPLVFVGFWFLLGFVGFVFCFFGVFLPFWFCGFLLGCVGAVLLAVASAVCALHCCSHFIQFLFLDAKV